MINPSNIKNPSITGKNIKIGNKYTFRKCKNLFIKPNQRIITINNKISIS